MRLSAALTRRVAPALTGEEEDAVDAKGVVLLMPDVMPDDGADARGDKAVFRASPSEEGTEPRGIEDDVEESSSQTSMVNILWSRIMKGCC